MTNLQQWLDHIESFHVNEIELDLKRISQVARQMDLLNVNSQVITIAGTNGKGSCAALVESFALKCELKIGCYTSPHLLLFNERIRVNGKNINDQALMDAFATIDKARKKTALTFFEFTTLAALLIFKQSDLDLVILEVGLGGRLDAVNLIEPNATIITTIDLDHEEWLGSDLESIAFEKSAICRTGITNWVGDMKSYQLIAKVRPEIASQLSLITEKALTIHNKSIAKTLANLLNDPAVNPYRLLAQNAFLAVAAFKSIFPNDFLLVDLKAVISQTAISGRFQTLSQKPLVIIDVAHNQQAAKNLSHQIRRLNRTHNRTQTTTRYALCGLMADKAISHFLSIMDQVIDVWYFVDLPSPRAATAEQLQGYYGECHGEKPHYLHPSVAEAYQNLQLKLTKKDQLFVFGSFITLAELLHYRSKNC